MRNVEIDEKIIFKTIRKMLAAYKGRLISRRNVNDYYDLWSRKEIMIEGKRRKEVFFAAVRRQGSYVGFYFMPVYLESKLQEMFGEPLRKLLKGKSHFHIREMNEELKSEIARCLEAGYRLYEVRRWI
ncbi:MAG: DUF1801 domain-containing protein [Spirochaetes bacterium]|nr:MAG: DUF1801 domain-containing protein [Spirochaetota bacterium]